MRDAGAASPAWQARQVPMPGSNEMAPRLLVAAAWQFWHVLVACDAWRNSEDGI